MIDDFIDDEELDEEEGQDESVQHPPRLIVKRNRTPKEHPTPLAFVIDFQGVSPTYAVTVAQWNNAAIALLKNLSEGFKIQSPRVDLPVVALRGRLELADQKNLRLERYVGRYTGTILWTETDVQKCRDDLNATVLSWLIDNATQLATTPSTTKTIDQLKRLAREKLAVETSRRIAAPYDWRETPSRTTKALSSTSYADLADFVARQLEGKVVFPGLGNLRRIVSGQLEQNQAELMTEPIFISNDSHFSFVVRIRVLSYPGRPLPVVIVEFTRRIWTHKLRDKAVVQSIKAYALPDESNRTLQWTLRRTKLEDGSWGFVPDDDLAPIARQYFVDETLTTEAILRDGAQYHGCKLLVVHKNGVGERTTVKGGVPDRDKMDGFDVITAALAAIGLKPWHGLHYVRSATRRPTDSNQHWNKRDNDKPIKVKNFETWLAEAQESIRACYAEAHHIIIAVQPGLQPESDAIFAEQCLHDILGSSVITTRVPIPTNVHGPRNALPEKDRKAPAERAARRIADWQPFINIVKRYEQTSGRKVDGVLVIAHKWYPGNQPDDKVNKRAARIALAGGLGVPVQYLLPRDEMREEAVEQRSQGKTSNQDKRAARIDQKFEDRLMIAWLDLAYKSLGRVRPRKLLDQARELYEQDGYPDRVLSLGIVRRNTSRMLANERSFLPYAIELDVESGICTACYAYESSTTKAFTIIDPLPLPDALVKLAGLGPVQLTSVSDKDERRRQLIDRTQTFFNARLADLGGRSTRPLVLVDADSARSVWPWLKDEEINPSNVYLAGGFHAEADWQHARLVRIRSNNSPKVLWDDEYSGVTEDTGEEIRYRAPGWAEAQLFKIDDTFSTNVYLSFGAAIRKLAKGRSGYREIAGMKRIRNTGRYGVAKMPLHSDVWATPTGLEIMVVRTAGDQPDRIARFVEWLRQCYAHFGAWTNKPAPLFFESVLKQYLADYELEDDEDVSGGDEAEEDEA